LYILQLDQLVSLVTFAVHTAIAVLAVLAVPTATTADLLLIMTFDEERIIADAEIVREGHMKLEEIMNPREFKEPARQALSKNKAAQLLLEKFEIRHFIYDELFPDEKILPVAMRPVAEKVIGRSVRTDLKIAIAIPKTLLESKDRVDLQLVLRFHGGGGVSHIECNLPEHQLTLIDHWKAIVRRVLIPRRCRIRA
jgi:hypothetical protein